MYFGAHFQALEKKVSNSIFQFQVHSSCIRTLFKCTQHVLKTGLFTNCFQDHCLLLCILFCSLRPSASTRVVCRGIGTPALHEPSRGHCRPQQGTPYLGLVLHSLLPFSLSNHNTSNPPCSYSNVRIVKKWKIVKKSLGCRQHDPAKSFTTKFWTMVT